MRCPFCGSEDTQVKDSRPAEDSTSIRRRRICPDCGGRFTTFERVQLRELLVVKKTGRKVPFDRNKLVRSFQIALRKRPVSTALMDEAIDRIEDKLLSSGLREVASSRIGELVMDELKKLDKVGYIRFASVYRSFEDVDDFKSIMDEMRPSRSRTARGAKGE